MGKLRRCYETMELTTHKATYAATLAEESTLQIFTQTVVYANSINKRLAKRTGINKYPILITLKNENMDKIIPKSGGPNNRNITLSSTLPILGVYIITP